MEPQKLHHDLGSVISTLKVVEAALRGKNEDLSELLAAALDRLERIKKACAPRSE